MYRGLCCLTRHYCGRHRLSDVVTLGINLVSCKFDKSGISAFSTSISCQDTFRCWKCVETESGVQLELQTKKVD